MALSRTMRIATYNLESLDFRARDADRAHRRIDMLAEILTGLDADILCLQEVNGQKPDSRGQRQLLALEKLLARTPYKEFHIASTRRSSTGSVYDVHNLVVASRWPIHTVRQYQQDLLPPLLCQLVTAEPEMSTPIAVPFDRPILYTTIDAPMPQPLHLITVHLRAPLAAVIPGQKTGQFTWKSLDGWAEGLYLSSLKRSGQALEVRLLVEQIFAEDPAAMIAVCGDFNCEGAEVPLKIVSGALEDIDDGPLRARQLLSLDEKLAKRQRYSLLHADQSLMFDHILVSRALYEHFNDVRIDNENLPDETKLADDDPRSHHAPLSATFTWPPSVTADP